MNKNPDGFEPDLVFVETGMAMLPESLITDLKRCVFGAVINHKIDGRVFEFWVNANTGYLMKKDVLNNHTVDMGQWPYPAGNHSNPNP